MKIMKTDSKATIEFSPIEVHILKQICKTVHGMVAINVINFRLTGSNFEEDEKVVTTFIQAIINI